MNNDKKSNLIIDGKPWNLDRFINKDNITNGSLSKIEEVTNDIYIPEILKEEPKKRKVNVTNSISEIDKEVTKKVISKKLENHEIKRKVPECVKNNPLKEKPIIPNSPVTEVIKTDTQESTSITPSVIQENQTINTNPLSIKDFLSNFITNQNGNGINHWITIILDLMCINIFVLNVPLYILITYMIYVGTLSFIAGFCMVVISIFISFILSVMMIYYYNQFLESI